MPNEIAVIQGPIARQNSRAAVVAVCQSVQEAEEWIEDKLARDGYYFASDFRLMLEGFEEMDGYLECLPDDHPAVREYEKEYTSYKESVK